jgi:hypothetical protein
MRSHAAVGIRLARPVAGRRAKRLAVLVSNNVARVCRHGLTRNEQYGCDEPKASLRNDRGSSMKVDGSHVHSPGIWRGKDFPVTVSGLSPSLLIHMAFDGFFNRDLTAGIIDDAARLDLVQKKSWFPDIESGNHDALKDVPITRCCLRMQS